MTITINLTSINRKQWLDIAKVAAWLAGSAGVSLLVALVTKQWGDLPYVAFGVNLVGYTLSRFFTQEEQKDIAALPAQVAAPVEQLSNAVTASVPQPTDPTKIDVVNS